MPMITLFERRIANLNISTAFKVSVPNAKSGRLSIISWIHTCPKSWTRGLCIQVSSVRSCKLLLCTVIDRYCKWVMTSCKTMGNGSDCVKDSVCPVSGEPLLSSRVLLLRSYVDSVLPKSSNFSKKVGNPYFNIKCTNF